MRQAVSRLLLFCICAAPSVRQSSPAAAPRTPSKPPTDSAVIQQIEDDWLRAERTTDAAALERVLSDDFVNLAPNGLAPGKAQLVKNWQPRAGQAPPYTVETSDMRIYILGDAAVAAYVKVYTANENGNVIHEDTTHVFTRDHGAWKLRISRSTFH